MQRTNLAWDKYMNQLQAVIHQSKFIKRAQDKPMALVRSTKENHFTSRLIHMEQAADMMRTITEKLGLNYELASIAMLMHDAGHPFSGHEGEEIFSYLGELYDTQFYHHNAKGIEVILSEDICGKAIARIPNIELNPELKRKLEEEFYYFLDIVISHDGEASKKDLFQPEEEYSSIKEAVYTKLKRANVDNDYKFIAQTPEGKVAKYADVIAYLLSDMQDAFRSGIMTGFSDDYLELFGEMFSPEYPGSREDKIQYAKIIIDQIKKRNLTETRDFALNNEPDKTVIQAVETFKKYVDDKNMDFYSADIETLESILEETKNWFRNRQEQQSEYFSMSEEQRKELEDKIIEKQEAGEELSETEEKYAEFMNTLNAQLQKIEAYCTKMIRVRSSAVSEITNKMQAFFTNDIIKNSQEEDMPRFSESALRMFYRAKDLNYSEFVQFSNWDWQETALPGAAKKLVEISAESLLKSGAIRNKFYDGNIRKYITNPESLAYMKTKYRREEEYVSYRKENHIGTIYSKARPTKGKFTGKPEDYEKMVLFGDLYQYIENEDRVFAIRYENTFLAIQKRIKDRISTALSETPVIRK